MPTHPADSRDAVQNYAAVPYKAPAEGMDLCPARVCPMARGRNDAYKKPEISSSMDKGRAREFMLELARVFPSQKKKIRDLKAV